jgi:hypothetical protein
VKQLHKIKRFSVAFYAAFALCLVAAQSAFATYEPAEYGDLTTHVGTEVGAAVPIALAAVGIFVGILVAYKLARRMIRA